uniref:O-methyltransferase OMT5 n=1 Tax=Lophophora williamsii TaxID=130138 RepID=A0AA51VIM1_LOPWI|nr:O-methyltransferase OMT5 [Lophophora williamsii]
MELDIIEMIKKSGRGARLTPAEIAAKLPTNNPAAPTMLRRLLDYLVSHSIFTVAPTTLPDGSVERRYGLAPVCKFLTPNDDGVSLAPFISNRNMHKCLVPSTLHLKDAVLEGGEPFEKAYGMSLYEYSGKHPEHQTDFHKAMSDHSTLVLKKLLKTYKGLEGLSSLVDVGGGNGATLSMILSKYPKIKGINFDQPHVVADAPVSHPGLEHVGGDIFVSIPKGDAIFLKWILHCFGDEDCIKILKNCYAALPEGGGKVIVCEYLLPNPDETTPDIAGNSVVQFDMCMMVVTGGMERTAKEFETLALAAGFQGFQVAGSAYNVKIMELLKKN